MKKSLSILCAFLLASCGQENMAVLVKAVQDNNPIEQLLDEVEDINARDKDGNTPLFHVNQSAYSAEKSLATARMLLNHGANVNARNNSGNTPLLSLQGIGQDYYEDEGEEVTAPLLLDLYVSAGADVFARNNAGFNALDLAYRSTPYCSNPIMVQKLKKYGVTSTPERELVWMAANGDVEGVRRLLAAGANPNACCADGVPAVIACLATPIVPRAHAAEVLQLLLQAGANPNVSLSGGSQWHILKLARWNDLQVTKMLLQYGAKAQGLPIESYATDSEEERAYVELLRKHGAVIVKE